MYEVSRYEPRIIETFFMSLSVCGYAVASFASECLKAKGFHDFVISELVLKAILQKSHVACAKMLHAVYQFSFLIF